MQRLNLSIIATAVLSIFCIVTLTSHLSDRKSKARVDASLAKLDRKEESLENIDVPRQWSKLDDPARFKVRTNGYDTLQSIDFYPWEYIVEPHKETLISVPEIFANKGFSFKWLITSRNDFGNDVQIASLSGENISFMFKQPTKTYDLTLSVYDDKGQLVESVEGHMMCKYVRREIRELLEEDRRAYFEALGYVARGTTDAVPGNTLLKADEKTLQYMMVKHIHYGACSPFHNGNGFFTSHACFTMEVEQAMQTYNPSVIQPYWDYTIDAKLYANDWYLKSPMFRKDWYGSASPDTEDKHISTTWIDRIDAPVSRTAVYHNSYGIITSTTNNNPSTSITRSHSFCGLENRIPLPTCKEMQGCLQEKTLESLRVCMEAQLHKDLHVGIGGVWECHIDLKEFGEKWPETKTVLGHLALLSETMANAFFNKGLLICPLNCELGTPFEECRCSCPSLDIRFDSIKWDEAYDILEANGVTSHFKPFVYLPTSKEGAETKTRLQFKDISEEASHALWLAVLDMSCHPGKWGTMCTGASAGDPIFWPLHPFFDRLWHYMRLNAKGEFDDMKWAWFNDENDCYGHRSYDSMPFYFLFGEEYDPDNVHYYTNNELFDKLDPNNPEMPYVYDHYLWSHCDE
mmetsp:Transcript_13073/g.19535  ORF Transcript_13073/g.19535 Transcript_13073/m.19535 type:complete len:631 (+) Transcript_13073:60-1952(+)|eukprot:CAMPEP_0171462528 /NCGR_PEP_ID=MMETSP0945-20130129/6530_1 /TAXON_ID=109269 /ORGANISM="Vaucheria litorea, Strain CCMP2940" /LENGTH=630 /DNA_ID=CAMNT_0011989073 /DNA_START=55 /DNA_END=1947 /DNA_ORIENTATION=-